ncbi:hypothetical protein DPX16_0084 [Anabarilius grahami]|uniref:Uncharacterized protein n=1 Tax=Anabarilius grahami TaxID=495550 RepID=A0A3N0ZA73_ANAGA|nr:hypothetical protein DPX16_0084 [Anabarilius grahami]
MSSNRHIVCAYSDSEEDFVPPSPLPLRRSSRIQCRDSSWAQWSSDKIINTLEAVGIPLSQGLFREDLLLMAQNTLGSPPITADTAASTSAPSGQTKQAGKKRAAKSSSPHPAKRSSQSVRITSPPAVSGSMDVNSQLIQVVHSLSDTVKGLESKVSNFENSFATSNLSANPPSRSLVIPTDLPPLAGLSFSSCLPSTSSALPASHHMIQMPFQQVSAPPVTSNFSLSTALPAQEFGRRFVSPAAVTVSPQIRANIIQVFARIHTRNQSALAGTGQQPEGRPKFRKNSEQTPINTY